MVLVNLVSIVYSLFPSALIFRFFIKRTRNQYRDGSGRFVSQNYVKIITLLAAGTSALLINPLITSQFQELYATNPLSLYGFLVAGVFMYFFVFKL